MTRINCHCTGYHFPHRHGGGACEHNPNYVSMMVIRIKRVDGDHLQFQADYYYDNPNPPVKPNSEIPF